MSEEDREHIGGLLKGEYGFSLYKDIVSGPIDVDKQDYLLRDSHFCGVRYGLYDPTSSFLLPLRPTSSLGSEERR